MSAKHLAVVVARAGSKSIVDKNLTELWSQTLINLAIEKAIASKVFSYVVLSTDYSTSKLRLSQVSTSSYTKLHMMKRRPELCQDDSMMIDVIKDVIVNSGVAGADYLWLLQPTSPFRCLKDFENIKRLIESDDYQSVISFKEIAESPNRAYTIKEMGEDSDLLKACRIRYSSYQNRQSLKKFYIRSGGYYVSSVEGIMKNNTLENGTVAPFIQDRVNGLNIDSHPDLVLAKYYVNKGTVKRND